jgi:hypothetical protein
VFSFPIFCTVYLAPLSLADFPLRWCRFSEAQCRPDSATLWIRGRQSAELPVSQTAHVHRTEFQAIGFSVASCRHPKPTLLICVLCFFAVHIPSTRILIPRPERSSGGWPSSEERPSFAHALANFVRTQTLIPRVALQVLLPIFLLLLVLQFAAGFPLCSLTSSALCSCCLLSPAQLLSVCCLCALLVCELLQEEAGVVLELPDKKARGFRV